MIDLEKIDDWGLVSALPITFYLAIIVLSVSTLIAIVRQDLHDSAWFAHILLLIFIIHGTPTLLYGVLRYSWAWKHIGVIDYVQRHGMVAPEIPTLRAYHNWPGFFTANLLLTEAAGLDSPMAYAQWAPVVFNAMFSGALVLVYRSFTTDKRLIRTGQWFFFLANWVGQDYFAPQALSFFLHLVILGICLQWFSVDSPGRLALLPLFTGTNRVWEYVVSLLGTVRQPIVPAVRVRPRHRVGLMLAVIVIYAAIASSHQLTPIMTFFAVSVLVLIRQCNTRTLPVLLAIITISWILYMAAAFMQGQVRELITSIGRVEPTLIDLGTVSIGQRSVALMARGLTATVWMLALIGIIRRVRSGFLDIQAIALGGAAFVILMLNSYGGEVLFRVYLFALPFTAFLSAGAIFPKPSPAISPKTALQFLLVNAVLVVGLLFSYYGKEKQYRFTPNEVAAAEFLYATAPPGSLLIEGSRNYPSQYRNYEYFTYVTLSREAIADRQAVLADPVGVLSRWMSNNRYSIAYIILTRSQKAMDESLGVLPIGALDKIEQALTASDRFTVILRNEDAVIFILKP